MYPEKIEPPLVSESEAKKLDKMDIEIKKYTLHTTNSVISYMMIQSGRKR